MQNRASSGGQQLVVFWGGKIQQAKLRFGGENRFWCLNPQLGCREHESPLTHHISNAPVELNLNDCGSGGGDEAQSCAAQRDQRNEPEGFL